jgi:hypothetical protein
MAGYLNHGFQFFSKGCLGGRRKVGRQVAKIWLCLLIISLSLTLTTTAKASQEWVYGVIQGDTLSEFSDKYLRSDIPWKHVQVLNNIADPDHITPGSKIRVPLAWLSTQPTSAEVIALQGDVQLRRLPEQGSLASPLSRQLSLTDRLVLGDIITTGEDSSVAVRFADASSVTILQGSELVFDHLSEHDETGMVDSKLRLNQGTAEASVTRQLRGVARFEIHTPSAISAVRGTSFRTSYVGNEDAARVEVLGGGVEVKAEGVSQLVPAGFGTRVKKGEAPIKPRELLPAPEVKALPDIITQVTQNVRWLPVSEASAYRVQLSTSESFSTLIWDQLTQSPEILLPDIADGDYFLRIKAIDSLGIEGRVKPQPLSLNIFPLAPLPILPSDHDSVINNDFQLRWSLVPDAKSYRLQVARDQVFTQIVVDEQVNDSRSSELELDRSGRYFWRVASIATDGEQGEFGVVSPLVVTRTHQIKQGNWLHDEQTVEVQWPSEEGELFYIQLAEDPEFKQLLVQEKTDKKQLVLPRSANVRYLRIASAGAQNQGKWGAVQTILPSQGYESVPFISWFIAALMVL